MNTSILEIISSFLKLTGTPVIREPYVYEHVFGPVVIMAFSKFLPMTWRIVLFFALVLLHLVVKELILDRIKHRSFNWPNVAERCFGLLLAGVLIYD